MLFYFSTKKCRCRMTGSAHAGVAELADARDLKSRGSNPVPVRPRSPAPYRGIEQLVARRAHNPEVGGSSPPPATRNPLESPDSSGLFLFSATFLRGLFLAFKSDPDSDPYGEKVRSRRGFSGAIFAVQKAVVSTRSMAFAASFCAAVVTWA